jgi:hypothetical protein
MVGIVGSKENAEAVFCAAAKREFQQLPLGSTRKEKALSHPDISLLLFVREGTSEPTPTRGEGEAWRITCVRDELAGFRRFGGDSALCVGAWRVWQLRTLGYRADQGGICCVPGSRENGRWQHFVPRHSCAESAWI